jgi:hypothetical protein
VRAFTSLTSCAHERTASGFQPRFYNCTEKLACEETAIRQFTP